VESNKKEEALTVAERIAMWNNKVNKPLHEERIHSGCIGLKYQGLKFMDDIKIPPM